MNKNINFNNKNCSENVLNNEIFEKKKKKSGIILKKNIRKIFHENSNEINLKEDFERKFTQNLKENLKKINNKNLDFVTKEFEKKFEKNNFCSENNLLNEEIFLKKRRTNKNNNKFSLKKEQQQNEIKFDLTSDFKKKKEENLNELEFNQKKIFRKNKEKKEEKIEFFTKKFNSPMKISLDEKKHDFYSERKDIKNKIFIDENSEGEIVNSVKNSIRQTDLFKNLEFIKEKSFKNNNVFKSESQNSYENFQKNNETFIEKNSGEKRKIITSNLINLFFLLIYFF